MTKKVYAVFGGGMQGKAAAYDLGKFGNAKQILIFDKSDHLAQQACDYVNYLLPKNICHPIEHNLSARPNDIDELIELLELVDACISCLPFHMNLLLAKCCIKAKCHFNDLGGNTWVVEEQLELHDEAKTANISIVPDCGLAPGANNIFAAYMINKGAKYIDMYCGGLPINKELPLGYKKTFMTSGLINEYCGNATYIHDGKIVEIPALDKEHTHVIDVDWEEDSLAATVNMEAAPTSGGTSTAPKSFLNQVQHYTYKTLRYENSHHFDFFRNLKQLRLLGVIESHLDEALDFPKEPDRVILIVEGNIDNENTRGTPLSEQWIFEVKCNANDNFTAMAQMTGFSAAIVTIMQAEGQIQSGAIPLELSVSSDYFIEEFRKRFPQLDIKEPEKLAVKKPIPENQGSAGSYAVDAQGPDDYDPIKEEKCFYEDYDL